MAPYIVDSCCPDLRLPSHFRLDQSIISNQPTTIASQCFYLPASQIIKSLIFSLSLPLYFSPSLTPLPLCLTPLSPLYLSVWLLSLPSTSLSDSSLSPLPLCLTPLSPLYHSVWLLSQPTMTRLNSLTITAPGESTLNRRSLRLHTIPSTPAASPRACWDPAPAWTTRRSATTVPRPASSSRWTGCVQSQTSWKYYIMLWKWHLQVRIL
jgi:hypothetical protein